MLVYCGWPWKNMILWYCRWLSRCCYVIANKFKMVFSTLLFGCYVDAYWPSEKSPSTVIYKTASCKWQIN